MHFDLAAIPQSDACKLRVGAAVPRPIAPATTLDNAGRVNAAPFRFFNADRRRLVGRMHGRGCSR